MTPSKEAKIVAAVASKEISKLEIPRTENIGSLPEIEKWSVGNDSAFDRSMLSDNLVLETMNSFEFTSLLAKRVPSFTPDAGLLPFEKIRKQPSDNVFLRQEKSVEKEKIQINSNDQVVRKKL